MTDRAMSEALRLADRIAELEKEIGILHTTMFAAAFEIQEHWDAHCDSDGYGPANLMHRLERGIASQYGYDAKTLQRIKAERDRLHAENEALRAEVERITNNRDMWKEQCARQSETLEQMRIAARKEST